MNCYGERASALDDYGESFLADSAAAVRFCVTGPLWRGLVEMRRKRVSYAGAPADLAALCVALDYGVLLASLRQILQLDVSLVAEGTSPRAYRLGKPYECADLVAWPLETRLSSLDALKD